VHFCVFCFVVSFVVRVFSKSKPTQSKRQTQWQVWIWAVSSLRSPIQSNPNLFVNIFRKVFIAIVGVDRRPHRCRFGSRVRSSHCSFIEDVYPWSLSPSKWAVLVVKLTYKKGEILWAKNSAEEPAKANYYIRIVSKVIRIY